MIQEVAGAHRDYRNPISHERPSASSAPKECGFVRCIRPLLGIVSRVSSAQTALRNCTRDEGRSFEVGNQVLIASALTCKHYEKVMLVYQLCTNFQDI